jgi:uncharacterized protein
MVSSETKSYSKRLLHLISWSHWFTFFNVWLAIAFSSFYLFSETLPESGLGIAYLVATWLSHMAFLTFVSFILIVFPLTLVLPHTRFIRTSASLIFTLGLLLLALDAFIYSRLGYHLNASSKDQIIALISNQISANSVLFWLVSLLLLAVVLSFELIVSNYAWKHLKQLQQTRFAKKIVVALVAAFIFSHVVHIWADAKLDYNVLKQDTLLPLSYPTTAKALLTKYGLFDRANYIERRNSPLTFTGKIKTYPRLSQFCPASTKPVTQSVFLVITDELLSTSQTELLSQRIAGQGYAFTHHIDNALYPQAWFNLFYSLPSIYQQDILAQQQPPAIFQLLAQQGLSTSYTSISEQPLNQDNAPTWLTSNFADTEIKKDIAELVFSKKITELPVGLHLIHFNNTNNFQYELFIDALLLAQRHKSTPDIIWLSSIGNRSQDSSLGNKSAYLVWPEQKHKTVNYLTSQMDVMPTLIKHWLGCNVEPASYSVGTDLFKLKQNRVLANTMTDGIMVFNKDKSVFVDQNGNFQSYSRQLNAPIVETADFPLMIDGVHYIKQFSQPVKPH